MKSFVKSLSVSIIAGIILASMGGCMTQRTVTQNGQVISQKYVVKRPFGD